MTKPYLSILIPSIRSPRLPALYESAKLACKKYPFEIWVGSPWTPPSSLEEVPNFLWLSSYANPSIVSQRLATVARGQVLFYTVDDCVFAEDSIDLALDLFQTVTADDVVNGRYTEAGNIMSDNHWRVSACPEFDLPNIQKDWLVSLQPIISKKKYFELGGLDCRFEYSNHGFHDLLFRLQRSGGKVYHSPTEICLATHYPGETGDHKPVDNAQTQYDLPLFNEMYSDPAQSNRIKIDFDNWQQYPEIWERRFGTGPKPQSYAEMYPNLS